MRAKHRSSNTGIFHNTLQLLTRDGGTFDSPKSLRTLRTPVRRRAADLTETCKRRQVNFGAFLEASDALFSKKPTPLVYVHAFARIRPRLFGGLSIVAGTLVKLARRCFTSCLGSHVRESR